MERRRVENRTTMTPPAVIRRAAGLARGAGTLEGYAAVFYRDGDPGTEYTLWEDTVERILPGAFDAALRRPDDVRAFVDHNPALIIGRTTAGTCTLRVDKMGLRYAIELPDTQCGRDVAVSVERGDLTGSSFAFSADKVAWRDVGGVRIREVLSVRLYEISIVAYPAYTGTTAAVPRSQERPGALRAHLARVRARAVEVECHN